MGGDDVVMMNEREKRKEIIYYLLGVFRSSNVGRERDFGSFVNTFLNQNQLFDWLRFSGLILSDNPV